MKIKDFQAKLDSWIFQKRYRLALLVLIGVILFAANFVPYLNLISNTYLVPLILLSLTPLILDVEGKIFIACGLSLFTFAFFIWFLGQTEEAETLTNYIFVFFLSGSLKTFFSS